MAGDIRYIKFSGDYEKFDEWKNNTKAISRHKGILKYLTKQREIPTKEDTETEKDKINIHEIKCKAWDFLIIILTYTPFGLAR